MRWVARILIVVWVLLLAWFISIQLYAPRFDGLQDTVLVTIYVGLSVAIAVSVWAVWMGKSGPVGLTVDEAGLAFRIVGGATDRALWRHLPRDVALLDLSETGLASYTALLWEVRRRYRPPADITKEAFDAILVAATKHGLSIGSSRPGRSWFGPCTVIRFVSLSVSTVSKNQALSE